MSRERDLLKRKLFESIGTYSVEIATSGEMAPPQYLLDVVDEIFSQPEVTPEKCQHRLEKTEGLRCTNCGILFDGERWHSAPSQHEAEAAVSRHKGATPETDALEEKFGQYYRVYDDANHEQEVWDLAERLECQRDELRAELEALRKQLKPDDLSRWKEAGVDKHKGEYYYECNVCGVSDWIANYGTYDQLKCKCNT